MKRTWHLSENYPEFQALDFELSQFAELDGQNWTAQTRLELAYSFASHCCSVLPTNHTHFANSASALFGFVRLGGNKIPLAVLPAGRELLRDDLSDELVEDLFLRQLLKWQYPSPNHNGKDYRQAFRIKPFLEVLRLVNDLGGLTKTELSLFGIPLIDYRQYEATKKSIEQFRVEYDAKTNITVKGQYIQETFNKRVRTIYKDDIKAGATKTRESEDDSETSLVSTKARNLRDYADSAMRYFLATGLFRLSADEKRKTYKLVILPERQEEVDQLLKDTVREPLDPDAVNAFYGQIGDPTAPRLPSDDISLLRRRLVTLLDKLPAEARKRSKVTKASFDAITEAKELKEEYARLRQLGEQVAAEDQQRDLQKEGAYDAVLEMFKRIEDRNQDMPVRALFFEWNTWRAMSALDDGTINANFKMDIEGKPYQFAPGRSADIRCEYTDFHLAVEVTRATGATQHTAEGDSVLRHVGEIQKSVTAGGDKRPVYGLFIASSLNDNVSAHFYGQYRVKYKIYGGTVQVVPLDLDDFRKMLQEAKEKGQVSAKKLHAFFKKAAQLAFDSADEEVWRNAVKQLAAQWLN